MKLDSLKNAFEFNIVNKDGIKFSSSYFMIIFLPNLNSILLNYHSNQAKLKPHFDFTAILNRFKDDNLYLGFKISKKFGNSVARNTIRRQVKALFQGYCKTDFLKLLQGSGIIFIPRNNAKSIEFVKLNEELIRALNFLQRKSRNKEND